MNGKQLAVTVIMLLLMYLSLMGQNAEALLQAGVDFDTAGIQSMTSAVITVVFVSVAMLLIPSICRLIKKGRLPNKSGKWICLCNSIGVFVLLLVLATLEVPIPGAIGGVGAVCFYFINKWLFVENTSNE